MICICFCMVLAGCGMQNNVTSETSSVEPIVTEKETILKDEPKATEQVQKTKEALRIAIEGKEIILKNLIENEIVKTYKLNKKQCANSVKEMGNGYCVRVIEANRELKDSLVDGVTIYDTPDESEIVNASIKFFDKGLNEIDSIDISKLAEEKKCEDLLVTNFTVSRDGTLLAWDIDESILCYNRKTKEFSKKRLRKFLEDHPYVDVVRFTTFFHQFTLIFDELAREKYVDWYGYSASVSPYILEQFEQEAGYRFRPEFIIDQGYMNNMYRIPSKEFMDFTAFQRREVTKLAKEFVDIVHEYGKEAMMFLGDHWIGMEPFMDEFKSVGLDAVVGSVGNGATLRLISDIPGVKYTEGRFLPYFFPDTFYEGGDPVKEAKVNWVTARRAILRKPIDRIGYGGYLKLAVQFPEFIDYVESVCQEFRTLYENIKGTTPYCVKTVAVLNCWGKMRAWGNHMVHHAIYHKQNYSYAGIMEALSGAPFDVRFITFDDIRKNPEMLKEIDVILNVGDADTAYTGGENWTDETIVSAINEFVYNGGGFIGIGEPTAHQWQGKFIQLRNVLGVERENGFDLNKDKYNWDEHEHFIIEDCKGDVDFGEGKKNIYAMPETTIIRQAEKEVQMAVNEFGDGRGVYISGLPYSFENSRVLYRAILWASHDEENLHRWFSTNYNVEVHAYVKNSKYCIVNNTYEPQKTTIYKGDGSSFELELEANEIVWKEI